LPYVIGSVAIAVVTAIIGQIVFQRKAAYFAEQG
jgi:ABC-type Mn2+/Zn2+ transport system permease subunit